MDITPPMFDAIKMVSPIYWLQISDLPHYTCGLRIRVRQKIGPRLAGIVGVPESCVLLFCYWPPHRVELRGC